MRFSGLKNFLRGRSTRREFWVSVIILIVVNITVEGVTENALLTSAISLPAWLVIAQRRLQDFGRSGVWGLSPFFSSFLLGVLKGAGAPISDYVLSVAIGLITVAIILVIGLIPGDRQENRFGRSRIKVGQVEPTA